MKVETSNLLAISIKAYFISMEHTVTENKLWIPAFSFCMAFPQHLFDSLPAFGGLISASETLLRISELPDNFSDRRAPFLVNCIFAFTCLFI